MVLQCRCLPLLPPKCALARCTRRQQIPRQHERKLRQEQQCQHQPPSFRLLSMWTHTLVFVTIDERAPTHHVQLYAQHTRIPITISVQHKKVIIHIHGFIDTRKRPPEQLGLRRTRDDHDDHDRITYITARRHAARPPTPAAAAARSSSRRGTRRNR